ncbi:S-layer homology domain-containing protein [Paenibacillus sp. IB182496]|uniref:S-layer homology domain-containing protein n=1 Tax=Paenibacillus sabuli TaxID=2772509 RepID=A0A927GTA8_9BACL|nr:S-layer homology domain-containing protein [Paenibacillus sabuli]MBD2847398.1 S-layer homology domain-containing protein [Paenibacillus sabuli]
MKLAKKITIGLLVFILFMTMHGGAITYVVAQANAPKTTVISNDYIKVTVDNGSGRFGIRTVDGQPIRKNDDNVNMLYGGDDPETSFTTFRIDGTDYIFGNPYKFGADFFSEITKPVIVVNRNGTRQIETVWRIKGVSIKQILMLYSNGDDLKNAGNVNVRYEVDNQSGAQVEIGSRILLDTMVADNDGPEFQIGTSYRAPLTVERKLVHDPGAIGIPEADTAYYKLPAYWVMRDKLDLTNPLVTNTIAYGFNNFSENNTHILDEMIVGHWNGLANTKWDYEVNPNLDFTRDTNDYGSADAAVALYWLPEPLPQGAKQSFETVYGLGEVIAPDKVFSIRYLDPVMQLNTLEDGSAYADEGIFDVTAEIENLPSYNMEHSNITADLTLESGLSFVRLDDQGRIVRDDDGKALTENVRSKQLILRKPATIEEAEQGIVPKYKPGDTVTVSFKVQAKGRPWPTTRQYLLTARSPETLAKLDSAQRAEDEGVMAQYESSKANFILLPPVGEASATYVYGLSPDEAFATDEKYVTVNLSNVEAYNVGDANSDPNFDLYLKETVTGARYKVPVKSSVLLQPTDDGSTGDMIITYRGGDRVDAAGDVVESGLGPELPLGEYQVEIDYKGDAGGDEEIAALFDITTAQTFLVTENEEARIRNSNLMAVYKQLVDLSFVSATASEEDLEAVNEAMYHKPFAPGADLYAAKTALRPAFTQMVMSSRVVDPDLDMGDYLTPDEGVFEEYALYNYRTFASEEEMEAFFEDRDDLESLVTIEGMVRQVGTGDNVQVVVDTSTEPAIINGAVDYQGKDLVFVRGGLEVFGSKYESIPLLDTLFVRGDGTLSVAGSGFVFHRGEWTLDFYNGFQKSIPRGEEEEEEEPEEEEEEEGEDEENDNPEDDSLNGSLAWAQGELGSRLNPMRQVMVEDVYFNRHSLFNLMPMAVGGFTFSFNEFILREGGVSFGGSVSFAIVDAEIKDVVFNDKGFVGVDASLKFELNKEMGLIKPDSKAEGVGGELNVTHYEQKVEGINNYYGLNFSAELSNMMEVDIEFALKQVDDGRILPDVIGFGTTLGQPGVLITGATYLTAIRGAIRELADTIAGGTSDDPFPLTLEAGVSLRFGIPPAYHFGDIDMTLKRTGIAIVGKLDFSTDPSGDDLIPMITEALLEAQWVTPWFVRLQAEVDVMGWDVIIGKAGIFVGQNLEKNRIDFEGYIGAKVQIPGSVPVVGGMPLSSVFLGLNNDKVWGSVSILLISLGITYYWGGGIEFGTSGEALPDGMVHLIVEDPEKGPQLLVIGQGIETVATSWLTPEQEEQEVVYRDLGNGVAVVDQGTMNVGIGGILSRNGGRIHDIPMGEASGNALLEVTYDGPDVPNLTLKDGTGKSYPIVYDNTNTDPDATAFTQWIPAAKASDAVDSYKAYIIVPQERVAASGATWTLTAEEPVDTKLLAVPTQPELGSVELAADDADPNRFTASWTVDNAKEGDTVSLYLTEDALSTATPSATSDEVLEPGEPGLLIAKDVPVGTDGSGSYDIDVTAVSLLGDTEDIRGLLQQGNYYLRAELKSVSAYDTMTSPQQFELIDPLAPTAVSGVKVEPAGNGMFALSFKPAAKKAGHEGFEHSYALHAEAMQGGERGEYMPFGELLFTEEELAPYWNTASGRYEGILVGDWRAVATTNEVITDEANIKYTGLEPGSKYSVAVAAATKPTKEADEHENYHFAEAKGSALTLLPVPAEPKLRSASSEGFGPKLTVLTGSAGEQTIQLVSDQPNIEVEALFDGRSIGYAKLANTGGGSAGKLTIDGMASDGTYGIELRARNTVTKDKRNTLLELTVDTLAPVLYIDAPQTGERTAGGKIRVAGQTSNDAYLTVGGQEVKVNADGTFDGEITVSSSEPTVKLAFVAVDGAGNENRASVSITNDGFEVPVGLTLRAITIAPGATADIEAALRYPDGKTGDGKQRFKTAAVKDEELERLSYALTAGEGVTLNANGQVLGEHVGSALVEVQYRVSDSVTLTGYAPVKVEEAKPTALQTIKAHAMPISGQRGQTKLVVTEAGEQLGYQLVYQRYTGNASTAAPSFGADLGQWTILPQDGIVTAQTGDRFIVAKRTSADKKAVAASGVLTAVVWGESGGVFFPWFGLPGGQTESGAMTINGTAIESTLTNGILATNITNDDVADSNGQLVIHSSEADATGYVIRMEAASVRTLAAAGRAVAFELPLLKLTLTAEQLARLDGDLELMVAPNSVEISGDAAAIADDIQAQLLGAGAGTSISLNLAEEDWSLQTRAQIAVPEGVSLRELSAVMLLGEDGAWTPLPWELEMVNGQAYVRVPLTDPGSLFFLAGNASFTDVKSGHWAEAGIARSASALLVLGKGQGKFDPNGRVTRAEFPTMLLRAAGLMTKQGSGEFPDVGNEAWYARSVGIAARYGLVTGMGDGSYAPQRTLTRMEGMAMIGRLLELQQGAQLGTAEANAILAPYSDRASIPEWGLIPAALAVRYGIIAGDAQGRIDPSGELSRAQAAVIASRLGVWLAKPQ